MFFENGSREIRPFNLTYSIKPCRFRRKVNTSDSCKQAKMS